MRTNILNGFGRTLGDSVIGLQALHTTLRLNTKFWPPILYRLPGLARVIQELYTCADFAEVRDLPWSHATPDVAFQTGVPDDAVIDIRDFAYDSAFLRTSMVDFFLGRLGINPAGVPAEMKRNRWLRPCIEVSQLDLPAGYTLVCPSASNPMRDMPEEVHAHILNRLVEAGPVVTRGRTSQGQARWVVSTDTAMVHLADAFDVRCLAFFPTHAPTWRVRDYPLCTPVPLAGPDPAGLEFARTDEDLTAARRTWFPRGNNLSWLDRLLEAGLGTGKDRPRQCC